MTHTLRFKIIIGAILFFLLLSFVRGYYRLDFDTDQGLGKVAFDKVSGEKWNNLESWRARIQERLDQGGRLYPGDFDSFFNDRFFAGRQAPFGELDDIRRQTLEGLPKEQRAAFEESWAQWSAERLALGRLATETVRSETELTLVVRLPGVQAKDAGVDVNEKRVKISYAVPAAGGRGVVKGTAPQNFVKLLPVPPDAAPGTAAVTRDGERLLITFRRAPGK